MADLSYIVERLSRFNNLSFTKKQWDIILKGCGCPKSQYFWSALRLYNLQRDQKLYTLIDIDCESFDIIWTAYCISNRESVKKASLKAKARKKAKERTVDITLYMVNGYLTTDKPIRE